MHTYKVEERTFGTPCSLGLLFLPVGDTAWENSRYFAMPPLLSPRNNVWGTRAEVLYWWSVPIQIWVLLLIGWSKFSTKHYQRITRSSSIEFLRSFPRRHFGRNHWWSREMSLVFSGYVWQLTWFTFMHVMKKVVVLGVYRNRCRTLVMDGFSWKLLKGL